MENVNRSRRAGIRWRRILPLGTVVLSALALSSCDSCGNFKILGYTTQPNYDCTIRTVYVPIFHNRTLRRGLEFEVTRAVIREIEAKTPYKVVHNPDAADTELLGTVVFMNKNILNRTPLNEIREGETVLGVELMWRDRRTGETLSVPRLQPGGPPVLPDNVPLGEPPPPPPPVLVTAAGNFIMEVGESITTADQETINRLAVQIVSMMEKPW